MRSPARHCLVCYRKWLSWASVQSGWTVLQLQRSLQPQGTIPNVRGSEMAFRDWYRRTNRMFCPCLVPLIVHRCRWSPTYGQATTAGVIPKHNLKYQSPRMPGFAAESHEASMVSNHISVLENICEIKSTQPGNILRAWTCVLFMNVSVLIQQPSTWC